MKRQVNITFQVQTVSAPAWDAAPIVYVLENVPADKDIVELCHVVSVLNNFATVRTTRLFLSDPITPKTACRYNGGYYQAKPTFYNKPKN